MNEELLQKILESNQKRTFYARITGIAAAIICLVFVVAGIILIPKVVKVLGEASTTVVKVEDSLGNIDRLAEELINTSANMNKVVEDNAQGLTDALNDLNSIDIKTLNEAIGDLHDTVEPMAKFFNAFR